MEIDMSDSRTCSKHTQRYITLRYIDTGKVSSPTDGQENCFNPLKTKRRLLYLKTQFVPRSKHFSSRL